MINITELRAENFKRVKVVQLTPSPTGLTVVGGNNNQGKTSVLDAIAWALGGDRFRPSKPQREGSVIPPSIRVTLSNGLIVERSGKNSSLKVIDPNGNKGGQQLLNSFIDELALNLHRRKRRRLFSKSSASGISFLSWTGKKTSSIRNVWPSAGLRNRRNSRQRICRLLKAYRLNRSALRSLSDSSRISWPGTVITPGSVCTRKRL